MKRCWIGLLLLVVTCQNSNAVEWLTDSTVALQRAKAEHKSVMLDFTGSDWCGWCKKLKSEVFDQPEYDAYAKANMIMVEVDFPRKKSLSASQTAANSLLASKYGVRSYPTIIVLDADGKKLGQDGYVEGGPQKFIASIEKNTGLTHAAAPGVAATAEPEPARHAPPEFVPIAPAPPMHYGDLALKSISGPKGHRVALINNETLGVGETAKIKTHDQKVPVTLTEILNDSVVVLIDGKTNVLAFAAQ